MRSSACAPDHEKAGAGVAHLDETALFRDGVRIVDLKNIFQRRRRGIRPRGFDRRF